MLILIIVFCSTFFAMEGVAWLMHKYVMHGLFWKLHKDHHDHNQGKKSFFELNDSFFIFFSIIAVVLYKCWGWYDELNFLASAAGVTAYGIVYLLVHDLFIHQRIKIWRDTKSPYLLAIRRAHKVHHKYRDKYDGECFGMLWVPIKYFKEAFKRPL